MTTPQNAASLDDRRRAVVQALELCLARSEVGGVVQPGTIEMYFATHAEEVWGQNEVRLQGVWRTLNQRPGLSSRQVTAPLLVLKSYEQTLGMRVTLPEELAAAPLSEGVRLRAALAVGEEEVARLVAGAPLVAAPKAGARTSEAPAPATRPARDGGRQVGVLVLLGVATLAMVGGGLFLAFRQTDQPYDVSDVQSLLRLVDARRDGQGLVARIADGPWEAMGPERRKEVAGQVFEKQLARGIRSMTLVDAGGQLRVQAVEVNGASIVSVR